VVLRLHTCRESSLQQARQLLQQVVGQLHQLTDMPPLQAVSQPAFWQLAQQAAAGSQALSQDLQLLGYDLTAAASSAASQLQQLQQLLGVNPAELQQQLLRSGGVDASLLQPGRMHELLAAVPGDAAAKQAVAGLQLLQVLSQALGLSAVHVCSSISPCELVARLTGRQQQQRELGEDLQQQLAAAAPQLLAAVQQLPAAALEQATVGSLLQLLNSKPELQVRQQIRLLLLLFWGGGVEAWLPCFLLAVICGTPLGWKQPILQPCLHVGVHNTRVLCRLGTVLVPHMLFMSRYDRLIQLQHSRSLGYTSQPAAVAAANAPASLPHTSSCYNLPHACRALPNPSQPGVQRQLLQATCQCCPA
jgi:hypothetical protein